MPLKLLFRGANTCACGPIAHSRFFLSHSASTTAEISHGPPPATFFNLGVAHVN